MEQAGMSHDQTSPTEPSGASEQALRAQLLAEFAISRRMLLRPRTIAQRPITGGAFGMLRFALDLAARHSRPFGFLRSGRGARAGIAIELGLQVARVYRAPGDFARYSDPRAPLALTFNLHQLALLMHLRRIWTPALPHVEPAMSAAASVIPPHERVLAHTFDRTIERLAAAHMPYRPAAWLLPAVSMARGGPLHERVLAHTFQYLLERLVVHAPAHAVRQTVELLAQSINRGAHALARVWSLAGAPAPAPVTPLWSAAQVMLFGERPAHSRPLLFEQPTPAQPPIGRRTFDGQRPAHAPHGQPLLFEQPAPAQPPISRRTFDGQRPAHAPHGQPLLFEQPAPAQPDRRRLALSPALSAIKRLAPLPWSPAASAIPAQVLAARAAGEQRPAVAVETLTALRPASYVQPVARDYVYAPLARPPAEAPPARPIEQHEIVEMVQKEVRTMLSPGAVVTSFSRADYGLIADQVYSTLVRRLVAEKERVGLRV
jgi:hypothetical protein